MNECTLTFLRMCLARLMTGTSARRRSGEEDAEGSASAGATCVAIGPALYLRSSVRYSWRSLFGGIAIGNQCRCSSSAGVECCTLAAPEPPPRPSDRAPRAPPAAPRPT